MEEENQKIILRFYNEIINEGNLKIVEEIIDSEFIDLMTSIGLNPEAFRYDEEGHPQGKVVIVIKQ